MNALLSSPFLSAASYATSAGTTGSLISQARSSLATKQPLQCSQSGTQDVIRILRYVPSWREVIHHLWQDIGKPTCNLVVRDAELL
jgi:hypothetical protein